MTDVQKTLIHAIYFSYPSSLGPSKQSSSATIDNGDSIGPRSSPHTSPRRIAWCFAGERWVNQRDYKSSR